MGNFIEHIEITNFKSIRHQVIDGCKRINVFIGYPNVGKSNILEALSVSSFFSYIDNRPSFALTDLIRLKNNSDVFYEGNTDQPVVVSFNNRSQYYMMALEKRADSIEIYTLKTRHNKIERGSGLKFNSDFNVDIDVLKENIKEVRTAKKENVKPIVPYTSKYQFSPNVVSDNYGSVLTSPYGDNLMRILSHYTGLRKDVGDLFEQYNLKLALDKASQSIRIIKENLDGTIFLLPYSLMADTLQRLIFYKAAIASNQNTVLLFEEPEAHMFPPYINKFTADIIYNKDNGNQYFLNTHSPFVLDAFLDDAIDELSVYAVGYEDGETKIRRLTDEQLKEVYKYGVDLFLNIQDYLKDE